MLRNKRVSAAEAAELVRSGDVIATGGFVGSGFPEELALAIEEHFLRTGQPAGLTLVYAAGQGDGKARGLNHFGHEKDGARMVRRVVGGHWGLVPTLGKLALADKIEAYNFPQGVISHLFRDIAAGKPGTLTRVGLHTFVDPRLEGGKMNRVTQDDLVKLIRIGDEDFLFYQTFPINIALLRGTTADDEGNITMEREALVLEALAIAQAVKNSGGIVMVQVERITTAHRLHPQLTAIPGILVDCVVVSRPENHPMTFAEPYNPAYSGEVLLPPTGIARMELDERKIIARRAAQFLKYNSIVNLGIGMPEGVARVAHEEDILHTITLTVEPGGIGGIPAGGLSFGSVANAKAIIPQPSQFDFYDGGGLDQAFLGMAEVDAAGNVNVSRFAGRIAGAGGFINISQNARAVYFMGTFTSSCEVHLADGRLTILKDSEAKKFVQQVGQITFNGRYAWQRRQTVYYITERAVFRLHEHGIELVEIAEGIDLDRDVLAHMAFRPIIAPVLKRMDVRIFRHEPMQLRYDNDLPLADRFYYDESHGIAYVNFEGLTLHSAGEVAALATVLEGGFGKAAQRLGQKVRCVVNYDNFWVAPAATAAFEAMVQHNQAHYIAHTSRYSTSAFFRRLAESRFKFINAQLYPSARDAERNM
jgi:propionate CoA-transferase